MKSDARQLKEWIKTKEDVKRFFQKMIDNKYACIEYMCEGRPLSELQSRSIKVVKISKVLGWPPSAYYTPSHITLATSQY